jgi:hypothetical protein
MSQHQTRPQLPVRRDLSDRRSSSGPASPGARKTILNDMRSTRARPT